MDINQRAICDKFKSSFVESSPALKVGISDAALKGIEPIHGLRHRPEVSTTGWYIWVGDFSNDADFFKPIHLSHLIEKSKYHLIYKYLGLAPGWRFIIDTKGFEDVWYDPNLLK